RDLVRSSPDGSYLLKERAWVEHEGYGPLFVVDGLSGIEVASGMTTRLPGRLRDGWVHVRELDRDVWFGPWMGTASGVYLPSVSGKGRVVGLERIEEIESAVPLGQRGNEI